MEFLPTITCDGDCELFRQFNPEIARRLPETTIEWKRSHGRPSKLVVVKAQITRLTKEHLEYTIDTTPSLHDLPFFHVFWTDCQDFDEYRSDVKEKIAKWLKKIKANGNTEWLIIQVNSQGSLKGNKPKLQLPRSSVFDKIKSDFGGGKANDRCIQLWEPSKHDVNPRSVESWLAFMNKLRQSILTAVDKNLKKFEEKVRSIRDKRTESNWNFTEYFLCHEEVAMVYEMMNLVEEALIHYDEVDALMNQLINKIKTSDHPGPLAPFTGECWCWDGASISQDSEKKLRARIKNKTATLLDVRNYLFIRQCALLFQLNRVKDVLQRMLDFMHNVVHELEILKVPVPLGAAACWVTLTSLQLIRATIQKNPELVTYSLHTAQLYQYAMQKLYEVGTLCGLMPDATSTDQQVHIACELTAGVGKNDEVKYSEGNPSNRLKTALSSKNGFKALYLELLQMAIKTYENIKRTRSARILGIDLGKFYMSGGSYGDAEVLLTDGYKMFAEEGWSLLAANTLVCLAKCQYQLRNWEKYAQSCAVLACQSHLGGKERSFYTEELFRLKDDTSNSDEDNILTLRADPLFQAEQVKLHLTKSVATIGEVVHVELRVNSGLEEPVDGCALSIIMRMSVTAQDSEPIKLSTSDNNSDSVDSTSETDSNKSRRDTSSSNDSVDQSGERKVKETFSLDSEEVCLVSGVRTYHLCGKVKKSGSYVLQQLVVKMGNLQLLASLQRLPKQARKFDVVSESPKISWSEQAVDIPPVAGLTQVVSLSISTGPGAIPEKSIVKLSSESGLMFLAMECGQAIIASESDHEDIEAEYSIKISNTEDQNLKMSTSCSLLLPRIPPYHKIQVDLCVFSPFENADDKQVVEHDALSCATWLDPNHLTSLFLTCYKPFVLEHILHATKYGDFLQIILTGTTPTALLVWDVRLKLTDSDPTKLTPLHTTMPQAVFYHSEVSFVWRLAKGFSGACDFQLNLTYCSKVIGETGDKHQFENSFQVDFEKILGKF